jgi:antitoxin MazE
MRNDTRVSRWGNSLAVRIPSGTVKEMRLAEGDHLSVDLASDGGIVLRSARRRYTLRELVSAITPANRHDETDWGGAEGYVILSGSP